MQSGNSPSIISKAQLAELAPRWDRNTRAMSADAEAHKVFGHPREMYAFVIALANGPPGANEFVYRKSLMVQPPFAKSLDEGQAIIHYTYGQDFDENGTHVDKGYYHWNKRDYMRRYPRMPLAWPPPHVSAGTLRLLADITAAALSPEYRLWWAANSI